MNSALSGEEIAHTLAKVRGMIPPEQLSEIEFQAGQIAIDLTPWARDTRLKEMMELVKSALAEKRTLRFDYTNSGGGASSREVEPYRLLYKGNGWYLQGYCLLRDEFRTFRFYRMDNLLLTDTMFTPRRFVLSEFDSVSRNHTSMVEVELRFGEEAKWHIVQFYGSDAIISQVDGMYIARVKVFDNEQGYNMLMLHGDQYEIISPPHLREYIARKAAAIAQRHELSYKNP